MMRKFYFVYLFKLDFAIFRRALLSFVLSSVDIFISFTFTFPTNDFLAKNFLINFSSNNFPWKINFAQI